MIHNDLWTQLVNSVVKNMVILKERIKWTYERIGMMRVRNMIMYSDFDVGYVVWQVTSVSVMKTSFLGASI